jgi:hypothetical protein
LETGERLNIMFSENSDITFQPYGDLVNGRDMIFNPTSIYAMDVHTGREISKLEYDGRYEEDDYLGTQYLREIGIERVWGGMHYVYVCGSSGNTSPMHYLSSFNNAASKRNFNLNDAIYKTIWKNATDSIPWGGYIDADKKYPVYECGPYDESRWLVAKFKQMMEEPDNNTIQPSRISPQKRTKMQLYNNVMYTHIPMQPSDKDLKAQWMSCDVTYKIRVTRPYMRYISRWYESPDDRNKDYTVPDEFAAQQGFPTYKLSTRNLTPTVSDTRLYQTILDNINIVPNPYYGASFYERNALETMVKITNLPSGLKNNAQVTVNIYTVNGILVRTLTKGDSSLDNETSFINWDLKNYANIPIAGGVYIIHVNCPGIGERTLKFFCTMRPPDLNTF